MIHVWIGWLYNVFFAILDAKGIPWQVAVTVALGMAVAVARMFGR